MPCSHGEVTNAPGFPVTHKPPLSQGMCPAISINFHITISRCLSLFPLELVWNITLSLKTWLHQGLIFQINLFSPKTFFRVKEMPGTASDSKKWIRHQHGPQHICDHLAWHCTLGLHCPQPAQWPPLRQVKVALAFKKWKLTLVELFSHALSHFILAITFNTHKEVKVKSLAHMTRRWRFSETTELRIRTCGPPLHCFSHHVTRADLGIC